MKFPLIVSFLLIAVLSGCSISQNQSPVEKTGLPGEFFNTEWQLIETSQADSSIDQEIPMLIFGWEENRVFGSDGCNRFSGAYLPGDGSSLAFDGIVSTRMACAGRDSEVQFPVRLSEVARYQFNDDFTELSLIDTDGNTLLAFEKTRLKRM